MKHARHSYSHELENHAKLIPLLVALDYEPVKRVSMPIEEIIVASGAFANMFYAALLAFHQPRYNWTHNAVPSYIAVGLCLQVFWRKLKGSLFGKRSKVLKYLSLALLTTGICFSLFGIISSNVNNSRIAANQRGCRDNLAHIWKSLNNYAMLHNGSYPETLDELAQFDATVAQYYQCPGDSKSAVFGSSSRNGHSPAKQLSYWFIRPPDGNRSDPYTVILFELPGNHGMMFNVLFSGGDVATFEGEKGRKVLAQLQSGNSHPTW